MENKIYKLKINNGITICHKMVQAKKMVSRMIGLMFVEAMPDCDGFLITPCTSIHTFFMRFPLDIVFLDKNFKVVKVIHNIKPWRMTGVYFKAHHVLEMRAGTLPEEIRKDVVLEAICIN